MFVLGSCLNIGKILFLKPYYSDFFLFNILNPWQKNFCRHFVVDMVGLLSIRINER